MKINSRQSLLWGVVAFISCGGPSAKEFCSDSIDFYENECGWVAEFTVDSCTKDLSQCTGEDIQIKEDRLNCIKQKNVCKDGESDVDQVLKAIETCSDKVSEKCAGPN